MDHKLTFLFKLILFYIVFSLKLSANEVVQASGEEASQFDQSAFIKLMNKLNGGVIPFPFSKLLDSFGSELREKGQVLFVPKGRSLVKEFADYKNPRIIVNPLITSSSFNTNPEFEKMGISGTDLYIGYAPNHKALEVISFNPQKNGYDFFLVENYEKGKTPKVINNPRICLSCHQNEGPIFSRFPWHELIGKSADNPLSDKTQISNEQMEEIKKNNPNRSEIEGIKLNSPDSSRFNIGNVAFFDAQIRKSNLKLLNSKICEMLCDKTDLKCQKDLILNFIDEKYPPPNFDLNLIERKIQSLEYKSSVIPNRDPSNNLSFKAQATYSDGQFSITELKNFAISNPYYDLTFAEDVDTSNHKVSKVSDSTYSNPSSVRPTSSAVIDLKSRMVSSKTNNEKIKILESACLTNDLSETIKRENISISPELLNKTEVIRALRFWPRTILLEQSILTASVQLKQNLEFPDLNSDSIKCNDNIKNNLPVYKINEIQNVVAKLQNEKINRPKELFQKYCYDCHGGTNAIIKLPLESLESLAKYKPHFSDKNVVERLDKKIMPPAFAKLQPSEKERAEMIQSIKELKK